MRSTIRPAWCVLCAGLAAMFVPELALASAEGDAARQAAVVRYQRRQYNDALGDGVRVRQNYVERARSNVEYQDALAKTEAAHAAYAKYVDDTTARLEREDPVFAERLRFIDSIDRKIATMRWQKAAPDSMTRLYQQKADLKAEHRAAVEAAMRDSEGPALFERWQAAAEHLRNLQTKYEDEAFALGEVRDAIDRAHSARAGMDQAIIELAAARAERNREWREEAREDYWVRRSATWWRSHPPYYDDYDGYDSTYYDQNRWWRR